MVDQGDVCLGRSKCNNMNLVNHTGFGAALISSQHLVPHWIQRLLEDCEDEETEESWSVQLLEGVARHAMWSTCELLGARRAGVAAQACRLLERYLSNKMRAAIQLLEQRDDLDRTWEGYKRSLGARLPLLMASCAKLAVKMHSTGIQLSAKKIRAMLLSKSISHSLSEVIDTEFEVFRALNFRVPLWTSVEAAELLAQEISLPQSTFCLIPPVMDYAEYRRDVIERRARWTADLPHSGKGALRSLHLAAAAVAAVAHIAGLTPAPVAFLLGIKFTPTNPLPNPIPRLAMLVRTTPLLLNCIFDLIVEQVLEENRDSDSISEISTKISDRV